MIPDTRTPLEAAIDQYNDAVEFRDSAIGRLHPEQSEELIAFRLGQFEQELAEAEV